MPMMRIMGIMIQDCDGRPVLIAGPTASGKSALALALAERDGGCVINADASQVYACWRVLTARPGDAELARAPHALYGHVACATPLFGRRLAARRRAGASPTRARRGLRPIIVGGTGLYFSALTEGIADIPEIPPSSARGPRRCSTPAASTSMLDDLRARSRDAAPASTAATRCACSAPGRS